MKISEFINLLKKIKSKYGDLEITFEFGWDSDYNLYDFPVFAIDETNNLYLGICRNEDNIIYNCDKNLIITKNI